MFFSEEKKTATATSILLQNASSKKKYQSGQTSLSAHPAKNGETGLIQKNIKNKIKRSFARPGTKRN